MALVFHIDNPPICIETKETKKEKRVKKCIYHLQIRYSRAFISPYRTNLEYVTHLQLYKYFTIRIWAVSYCHSSSTRVHNAIIYRIQNSLHFLYTRKDLQLAWLQIPQQSSHVLHSFVGETILTLCSNKMSQI